MFVAGYHPSYTPGIMFLIDKLTGKIEIGKKNTGSTEILGRLFITNNGQSTEFNSFENRIEFVNKSGVGAKYMLTIPYGINFTDYFPKIPNWLSTSSTTSTPSPTNYSLFNFYNVLNSGPTCVGVRVNAHDESNTLLENQEILHKELEYHGQLYKYPSRIIIFFNFLFLQIKCLCIFKKDQTMSCSTCRRK
jgi:hypothetical protein